MPLYLKKAVMHLITSQLITVKSLLLKRELFVILLLAVNQAKAGECGAIDAIVSAMKTHISNVDACKWGCGALMNVTANGKIN